MLRRVILALKTNYSQADISRFRESPFLKRIILAATADIGLNYQAWAQTVLHENEFAAVELYLLCLFMHSISTIIIGTTFIIHWVINYTISDDLVSEKY